MKISMALAATTVAALAAAVAHAQTMRIEVSPDVGTEAVAAAGEAVYSYRKVYTLPGAQTEAVSAAAGLFGGVAPSMPAGTKLVTVPTSKKLKACIPAANTFDPVGPCYLDDDGDGKFDRVASDNISIAIKLKAALPYSSTLLEVAQRDSLQRVFLYQGASGDTLRFSYREFGFDMARPAFTEEITVPREAFPAMVRIKGLQLEILGVTGMGLRYRLVQAGI